MNGEVIKLTIHVQQVVETNSITVIVGRMEGCMLVIM